MAPKRKNADSADARPSKIVKPNTPSTPTSSQHVIIHQGSPADQTGKNTTLAATDAAQTGGSRSGDDHIWQILDGDNRDPVLLGTPAPHRLTLRFKHRDTGEEKSYKYQRKTAKQVNWKSKEDIRLINIWRTQTFNRTMNFKPLYNKRTWAPFESAYLELFHEKLALAAEGRRDFRRPGNIRIVAAFNEYFEYRDDINDAKGHSVGVCGARDTSSIDSFMRRKNTRLSTLREEFKKYPKDNSEEAYAPDITDEQIEAWIRNKTVTNDDGEEIVLKDSTSVVAETGILPKKVAKSVTKPSAKKIVKKEALKRLKGAKVQKPGAVASKNSSRKTLPRASTRTGADRPRPIYIPDPDDDTSSNGSVIAVHTPQVASYPVDLPVVSEDDDVTAATQPRRNRSKKPSEAATLPTSPTIITQMRSEGWQIPSFPANNEQAIQKFGEDQIVSASEVSWDAQAVNDLEARLKKYPIIIGNYYDRNQERSAWYADAIEDTIMEDAEEPWEEVPSREPGAAGVNGLLNAADLPPVGYRGPISEFITKLAFSESEIEQVGFSEVARRKFGAAHDQAFNKYHALGKGRKGK